MTKNEYLDLLSNELKKNNVLDIDEIVSEYEQHFEFKLADGYSQEEIAAKLDKPEILAAQFESLSVNRGRKALIIAGMVLPDVVAGLFFIMLWAWAAVMTAASVAFIVLAVCLFGGLNIYSIIPTIPYWCGAVFGISSGALAVLTAVGSVYFSAFIRQLMRAFARFHHNTVATAVGQASLPPLGINPRFEAKMNRRLRTCTLFSLALFVSSFAAGIAASAISAGALEFWHVWGWFM